jgi:hypothetical protein
VAEYEVQSHQTFAIFSSKPLGLFRRGILFVDAVHAGRNRRDLMTAEYINCILGPRLGAGDQRSHIGGEALSKTLEPLCEHALMDD